MIIKSEKLIDYSGFVFVEKILTNKIKLRSGFFRISFSAKALGAYLMKNERSLGFEIYLPV